MMRVNLLPPEILERRTAEKRIGWVAVGAIAVALVLAGVWATAAYQLQVRKEELASIQQQTQAVQAQADQLAIFEMRAGELDERREVVLSALGGRVDWPGLLDEVSLVLPSDLWAQTIVVDEDAGLSVAGYAVDSPSDTPDQGHKAIAKGLVRLADLDSLYDVWLLNSAKTEYAEQDAIQFTFSAKVTPPAAEGEAQ